MQVKSLFLKSKKIQTLNKYIMKALTYAGMTGELPVDIKIVERGKMIVGANDGDEIISYFTIDGINFAGHFGVCSLTRGTIGKAMADSDLPKRTGFLAGEQYNYAVYNGGQYKKVIWTNSYTKSGHTLWEGELGEVVEIQDNPYYSLDPVWPNHDYNIMPYGALPTTAWGDRYLYKFIQWNKYTPEFYKSWTIELVEGTGKLTVNVKNPSKSTYRFTPVDIANKQVSFKIVCTPLQNSGSKDTERIITLTW